MDNEETRFREIKTGNKRYQFVNDTITEQKYRRIKKT